MAVAMANDTVELWDMRDSHEVHVKHTMPHGELIKALSFSGDGSRLLTQTDKTVRIFDVATSRTICPPMVHA